MEDEQRTQSVIKTEVGFMAQTRGQMGRSRTCEMLDTFLQRALHVQR